MSKIANYFNKADRKKLFFDYLKLIGILEIVIFIVVVLWASDDKYHRVQSAFPWREYVFVAFAFPIVFTFLMGAAQGPWQMLGLRAGMGALAGLRAKLAGKRLSCALFDTERAVRGLFAHLRNRAHAGRDAVRVCRVCNPLDTPGE